MGLPVAGLFCSEGSFAYETLTSEAMYAKPGEILIKYCSLTNFIVNSKIS